MPRFLRRSVLAARPNLILAELIKKSHSCMCGASYAAADGSAETSGLFLLAVLGILGAAGFLASDERKAGFVAATAGTSPAGRLGRWR
jgi:hypothetical protein